MTLKPDLTIAVLPFVNMSSDPETEYFSDGMTEEIINALARTKGLKVTSRTSAFFFKNKNLPISQIGGELKVSTILEGSVRLAGSKMRITAQLIDVKDDFHFWSETFDRSVEHVFEVQDEISLLIADKLREHIGHFEIGDKLVDAPDIPVETYQLYLKGRYHLMKLTLDETLKAIAIFEEVIAAQPDFPHPYLDINQGYTFLGTMGQLPAMEAFAKAQPFLARAIELNENLPEAQLNLAWIACWQNWDLKATYDHLKKALELRPADNIYLSIANTLGVEGNFKASHQYTDKALQLDPLSGINHHFKGFILYMEEKYDEAMPWFEKSLHLKPELTFPYIYMGLGPLLKGNPEASLSFFQNMPDLPSDLTQLGGSTMAFIALGDEENAQKGIVQLEEALQTDAMGSAMAFLIYCNSLLGKVDEAFSLMEKGLGMRLPNMLLLFTEPILKPLRTHSRFQELRQQALGSLSGFGFSEKKYKKLLFTPEEMIESRKKLEAIIEDQQPFLDPALSLRSLAAMLEMPPNHLSQLLNQSFSKNFAEFVNSYRVKAFKTKAADPSQQHLTLLAMAYDSGFNSKTVFNTWFKKIEGKTPKAFWKEVVK